MNVIILITYFSYLLNMNVSEILLSMYLQCVCHHRACSFLLSFISVSLLCCSLDFTSYTNYKQNKVILVCKFHVFYKLIKMKTMIRDPSSIRFFHNYTVNKIISHSFQSQYPLVRLCFHIFISVHLGKIYFSLATAGMDPFLL